MAASAIIHKSTIGILVAGAMALAVACGSTDQSSSDGRGGSSTDPTASAVQPSAGPVCDDGLVPALAALDQLTGDLQWTYCTAELAWREVRGATDAIVYTDSTMPDPSASASELGQVRAVVAVDARSGAELWQVPVPRQELGWPPGPFAGGGVVVVATKDDDGAAIVGLDAESGDTMWRVATSEFGDLAPSGGRPDPVIAPLANTDEVAVVAVPSGLVGLDRLTGAQLWSSTVSLLDESGVGAARGPAAVDGSTVMIPAASEVITGVLTDSGAIVSGPDLPAGETVTIPVGPSTLIAVDASTGATLWQGSRLDHPVAADGHVVGYVHAGPGSSPPGTEVIVDNVATGAQLWSKPGRESYGDLWALGDGAVYVNAVDDGSAPAVVAYELGSGDERWRRSTDSIPGDPQQTIDGGVVVLGGDLAVLSAADGTTRWTVPASVSPEAPMSSVGHNAASIFVSFNGLSWGD